MNSPSAITLGKVRLSSIYVLDQVTALDFYVGILGLEVGTDADLGFMRWLTVRVPGDDREILLERPGAPSHDPATADQVRALVSKGAGGGLARPLLVPNTRFINFPSPPTPKTSQNTCSERGGWGRVAHRGRARPPG